MRGLLVNVALFILIACGLRANAAEAAAPTTQPLRVLLTTGGHGFEEKPFYAMWDALPGIVYTRAPLPQSISALKPGVEKKYDVLVMYDMIKSFTPEQQQAFTDLLRTGIGVVSLHHNLCSHVDWPEYGRIVGGRYFQKPETIDGKTYPPSHYLHDQHFDVRVVDPDHPITRGLADFKMDDEAYSGFYLAPRSHVLLTVDHPKCDHNVAWTTEFGKSRVFYLMFGHGPSAWNNPAYQQLIVRGMRWAAWGDAAGVEK